jgi:YggT family protein
MEATLAGYRAFVGVVRYVVFGLAVVAALFALVDWAVRTRRLNPFGPVARFFRRVIDPLMLPIETRIVKSGGQPQNAPWFTLAVIVVGGLLLFGLLDFLGMVIGQVGWAMSSPGRFGLLVLSWGFLLLKVALVVRVVSSWIQVSPYSRWVRWSFVLTDWMVEPLRRLLQRLFPGIRQIDFSPLLAFFLLSFVQSAIGVP